MGTNRAAWDYMIAKHIARERDRAALSEERRVKITTGVLTPSIQDWIMRANDLLKQGEALKVGLMALCFPELTARLVFSPIHGEFQDILAPELAEVSTPTAPKKKEYAHV